MKLIITEKPSVARDIARVLKISQKKDGYFENNEYMISWAFGHLIRLSDPPAYNPEFEKWKLDDLPIIPEQFITEIQPQEHIQTQFAIIKKLFERESLTEVICATDAGREGELIFRLIYETCQSDKPISRLWISSQTDQAILEGFAKLKPGEDYIPLFDSARSRSEADWIIGINATRAYTGRFSRGQGVMSVGRVQTPVLKLIVDRYQAHTTFDAQNYFEIETEIHHANGKFLGLWIGGADQESRLFDKTTATNIVKELQDSPTGNISKLTQKTVQEKAPLPYDLTELQKDANKKFKYSADDTLKLMQSLYEKHKVLTYPRTSSRYLSADIKPKIPGLLKNLSHLDDFARFAQDQVEKPTYTQSRIFDDKKVTDHHAIIPTDKRAELSSMSAEEKAIYLMVIRQFLASLMPDCIKDQTEVISTFGTHPFRSFGSIITSAGWRDIYGIEADDAIQTLPKMAEKDPVTHQKMKAAEKKTKAPPLYTEASILAAMETAGKTIEDEELRQAMKHCGLGTPATRAQIIERLISVSYIIREKNKLIPTPKGIQLIGYIQDKALLSAELTGEWEMKLNQMSSKSYQRTTYMDEIKAFAKDIVDNVKNSTQAAVGQITNPVGNCPICNAIVSETKMAFSCSAWRTTQCDFKIWKVIAGKPITDTHAKTLLKSGKTKVIKGFKSREGNSFDAALVLKDNKVSFEFDNTKNSIGLCPNCNGQVVERKVAYGCENWKSTGCNFVIWKESSGKTITKEEAQALLVKS